MSTGQWTFFKRFSRLTDEFRNAVTETFRDYPQSSYQNALEAMLQAHRANRRESLLYRLLDQPWLFPLSSLLEGLKAFSDEVESKGIAASAADLFRKMGVEIEAVIAPEVRAVLGEKPPLLLVGEHPSPLGFDVLAVAASLVDFWGNKSEPRLLAVAMVAGMCPGLRHSIFPITMSQDQELRLLVEGVGAPRKPLKPGYLILTESGLGELQAPL